MNKLSLLLLLGGGIGAAASASPDNVFDRFAQSKNEFEPYRSYHSY